MLSPTLYTIWAVGWAIALPFVAWFAGSSLKVWEVMLGALLWPVWLIVFVAALVKKIATQRKARI